MSLTYLSGDDAAIGKKKKSGGGSGGGKKAGGAKKKTFSKKVKKTKEEKKAGRKRVFKKVAKVAVGPARVAFLTVVGLNGAKLASKLARVWNKPGGKEQIAKFWAGFGGDINKLKAQIIKGSKQQISGEDQVGAVALTAAVATATPIIVALVPIIKHFKAAGSPEEAKQFNDTVEQGKKDLADNSDVPKAEVSMPKNKDAGIVTDKDGEAQEDKKQTAAKKSEKETGGTDNEDSGSGTGAGGAGSKTASGGGSEEDKKAAAEKTMASNFSPLGFFFTSALYLMMYAPQNNLFVQLIGSYCVLGMLLIPAAIEKNKFQKIAYAISFTPINLINRFNQQIKTQWQKTKTVSQ